MYTDKAEICMEEVIWMRNWFKGTWHQIMCRSRREEAILGVLRHSQKHSAYIALSGQDNGISGTSSSCYFFIKLHEFVTVLTVGFLMAII